MKIKWSIRAIVVSSFLGSNRPALISNWFVNRAGRPFSSGERPAEFPPEKILI